ncbi:MAG: HAD family hydrolase [Bacillota bacterium]
MITTVLFDLDGTLLDLDKRFVPRYLERLASRMEQYIPRSVFLFQLGASTAYMIHHMDKRTNKQKFFDDFLSKLGIDDRIEQAFYEFYEEDFPSLKGDSCPLPGGREAYLAALSRGMDVVIASNPVLPEVAMEERLRWANVGDLPKRYVTSLENMKACKPYAEYYSEILDTIGKDAKECLMVGNDALEDLAASSLGINTYYVTDRAIPSDLYAPDYTGTMRDLAEFIRNL